MSEKLDTRSTSAYTGLAERTLERWRLEGKGPRFLKLGGKVLYLKSELDRFLAASERHSTADRGPAAR